MLNTAKDHSRASLTKFLTVGRICARVTLSFYKPQIIFKILPTGKQVKICKQFKTWLVVSSASIHL